MGLLLLTLLLFPQSLQAAPPPAATLSAIKQATAQPTADLLTIETLEARIPKKYRNVRARTLKQAYSAWQKGNGAQARSLCSPLRGDPLWGDFALWISYASQIEDAETALSKKSFAEAAGLAEKAIQQAFQVEARFPFSPFLKSTPKEVAQAELLLGQALAGQQKGAAAQVQFERGFVRYANLGGYNSVSSEALGEYAAFCAKKRNPACEAWLYRLANWFPRGSVEGKAIAKSMPDILDRPRLPSYGVKASQGYKAPDLDQTAYDTAVRTYFDGKFGQSIKQFQQFLDDYPRSSHRFRARYWLTQALTQQNDHEKAQSQYRELYHDTPLSYYGLLAALATGQQMDQGIAGTLPTASETDVALTPIEQIHIKRAQAFIAENAPGLAQMELHEMHGRDALSSPFLMYLALLNHLSGNHVTAFSVIADLIARNYDGAYTASVVRMIFPSEYMALIKKYADENNVDPLVVLSLIKQESAFDAGAGSAVGAMGLMQLMPATAYDTDPDIEVRDLLDAETSIRVGTRYLHQLLTRYNGNMALSLAAYNAGPNAVDRWLKENSSRKGMLEFIEAIPYRETREYVAGIIRNYFWYARRINGDTPTNLNYFWTTYGPVETPAESK